MRISVAHPGASWATSDVYDGMLPELRALGHECLEYRLDKRLDMQALWLRYLWRRAGKRDAKPTIADQAYLASVGMIEQALLFEVDGLLIWSAMFIPRQVLQMARRAGIRVGIILSESPYDQEYEAAWVAEADVAWTNERTSVAYLKASSGNPNVYYLPHAFDPLRHYVEGGGPHTALATVANDMTGADDIPSHDAVFVGSAFVERLETLQGVNWDGIDFGLYGNWQMMGSRSKLRRFLSGGIVDNAKTASLYRRAKVGLNLYRQSMGWGRGAPRIDWAESLNPRALELAACGVFQVSDDRAEVREVFGDAVPTYRDSAELEAVIRRALADEDWRQRCAMDAALAVAGPAFTFAARAAQVSDQLEHAWSRRTSVLSFPTRVTSA